MKTPDEDPSPSGDGNRYETARGWQPKHPDDAKGKRLRDRYRKKNAEEFSTDSLFRERSANKCFVSQNGRKARNPELFGPLWREGELAVLFAEPGLGKSILATQIAESVARGVSVPGAVATGVSLGSPTYEGGVAAALGGRGGSLRPRSVLYLDFELTDTRFTERYTCPSPIPGALPRRYRFSEKHRRVGIKNEPIEIPEIFAGDLTRYYLHSVNRQLNTDARVLIIDSLAYLDPNANSRAAHVKRMRALKLLAMTEGLSILVLTGARASRLHSRVSGSAGTRASLPARGSLRYKQKPIELADLAYPEIAEIADTIFAIGRTTIAPDWRYLKHLKSNYVGAENGKLRTENEVLVYQIARTEGFSKSSPPCLGGVPAGRGGSSAKSSPPYEGGVAAASADGVVLYTGGKQVEFLRAPRSRPLALPPSHETASPFLGFAFQGVATEQDMLRDYAAEAAAHDRAHEARLNHLRNPKNVVDMLISREYREYMER